MTSAPTMEVETVNDRLSAILIDPPDNGVSLTCEKWNVKGLGTVPAGLTGAGSFFGGGSRVFRFMNRADNNGALHETLAAGKDV